jgi:outer membrane protein OmpA-like peptidoglycan-associated protein
MFGVDTAALWALYLARTSAAVPRPHQTLTTKAPITTQFTAHHKTAEAEEGLVAEVIAGVNRGTIVVTPGTPRRMTLADAIGAGTVFTMLNKGGSQEMNFDQVASTIPGNIAGGVGSGGPPGHTSADPDTRNAWGDVEILVTPGPAGGAGTVSVTPSLNFHVHDTMDFCPGALGGAMARNETIPMSRLEATEATFGPVFAADVPFDVDYQGPGTTRTAPHTPLPPPVPPVPPPPPVVLPSSVLFDFDSAVVTPDGKDRLSRLLPRLRASPSTDIIGHTDSRGREAYNQRLSERRAEAVVAELIRQDPSLAGRLHPSGRGENAPVASNDSDEGRARNRRVELVFGP